MEKAPVFRLICFLNTELQCSELIELDVCGRPIVANPVTNGAMEECISTISFIFSCYKYTILLTTIVSLIVKNHFSTAVMMLYFG